MQRGCDAGSVQKRQENMAFVHFRLERIAVEQGGHGRVCVKQPEFPQNFPQLWKTLGQAPVDR
jgi:hypothetical protein